MKNCNNCEFQKWIDTPPFRPSGKPFDVTSRPACLYEKFVTISEVSFKWCPSNFECRHVEGE